MYVFAWMKSYRCINEKLGKTANRLYMSQFIGSIWVSTCKAWDSLLDLSWESLHWYLDTNLTKHDTLIKAVAFLLMHTAYLNRECKVLCITSNDQSLSHTSLSIAAVTCSSKSLWNNRTREKYEMLTQIIKNCATFITLVVYGVIYTIP